MALMSLRGPGSFTENGEPERMIPLMLSSHWMGLVHGCDFTINVQFPYAACDQLGVLGTKIEDQYLFCHGGAKIKEFRTLVLLSARYRANWRRRKVCRILCIFRPESYPN